MAISNAERDKLDKMCKVANDTQLGTIIQTLQTGQGTATADSDDQTAGSKTIDTGVTVNGFIVQVYRSNILLDAYDVQASGTEITIATNGADYVVTDGDVINYIVY